MFDIVLTNFFSIGALIPVTLFLFLGLFFFIVPDKSRSTSHLAYGFLFLMIFNFGYLISGSIYHPIAVFRRWITVGSILFVETHITMFIFYLYEEKHKRFGMVFKYVQYLIAVIASLIFFLKTADAPRIFLFNGHYWDFNADDISKAIGIIIQLYIVIFIVTMIWKAVSIKGRERWTVLLIGVMYLLATIIPSITNVLSRDGALDRGTFQITWDLFNVLGLSLLSILYINFTRDRTTFMGKILGISFVTLLLLLQGLSYYSLQDNERAYDDIHRTYTRHTTDTNYIYPDTRYIMSYNTGKDRINCLYCADNKISDSEFVAHKNECLNAVMWGRIKKLYKKDYKENLKKLLQGSHYYFKGYKND